MDEVWLSTSDAAARLGVSPQMVLKLIANGALASRREPWGKRSVHVISAAAVEQYVAQRSIPAHGAGSDDGRLEQLEFDLIASRARERELEAALAVRDAELARVRGDVEALKALLANAMAQQQQLVLDAVQRLGR